MKIAAQKKKVLPGNLPRNLSGTLDSVQDEGQDEIDNARTFLCWLLKTAGISAKQFQYDMRVSKTTQQKWFREQLADPIERARQTVALIAKRNPSLVSVALLHIAGDGFDGLVLDQVKKEAIKELAKVVKE